jgi:hypothetical protein
MPMTLARLTEVFSTNGLLTREAIKLALYCKLKGSAVGYGVIEGAAETAPFRLELLRAMETFVIGHEVGHCCFEERRERGNELTALEEEAACDQYTWSLSRAIGIRDHSWDCIRGGWRVRILAICGHLRTDSGY